MASPFRILVLLFSLLSIAVSAPSIAQQAAVELFLVADSSFYDIHGEDTEAAMLERLALANVPFQNEGLTSTIQLRPSHVIVITNPADDFVLDVPEVNGKRDVGEIILAFNDYRKGLADEYPHDLGILISGAEFSDTTVTYVFSNSICSSANNAGILEANRPDFENLEAHFIARVIALTMGVPRDGSGNDCPTSGYLMSPTLHVVNDPVPPFSECSIDYINTELENGRFACFFSQDAPTNLTEWVIY